MYDSMTVELKIVKPQHNAFVKCGDLVTLQGAISGETSKILYYRWYSGFIKNTKKDHYSVNDKDILQLKESSAIQATVVVIGSHPVYLMASDSPSETADALKNMKFCSITGGSDGQAPCVIHVLNANILAPNNNETVFHNKLILKAEAPTLWTDEKYQKYNRLSYRWELHPVGEPLERPDFDSGILGIKSENFSFESLPNTLPCTFFTVSLPDTARGKYEIVLSVGDKDGKETPVQSKITVTAL
jgi:hypothetical protein